MLFRENRFEIHNKSLPDSISVEDGIGVLDYRSNACYPSKMDLRCATLTTRSLRETVAYLCLQKHAQRILYVLRPHFSGTFIRFDNAMVRWIRPCSQFPPIHDMPVHLFSRCA